MERQISSWLIAQFGSETAHNLTLPVSLLAIAFIAVASYVIYEKVIVLLVRSLISRTTTTIDDELLNGSVLRAVGQIVPALIVAWLLPKMFVNHEHTFIIVTKLTRLYIIWTGVYLLNVIITTLFRFVDRHSDKEISSLNGIVQMVRLVVAGIALIASAGILFNRSPLAILTALGASAAILMLVFRDTILGLVASVQLTANKMLRVGDWIICSKAGANGEVIKISLTTVKVRNWDNSIVTIPPYTLVSDSFQNFQNMRQEGGRRVSRSVCIDIDSVRFLTGEETASLVTEGLVEGGDGTGADRHVNLTLLRRHLERWLGSHSDIVRNGDIMYLMVRQLQPTPQGVPLELYFFTDKTVWTEFERVQSDIFDYVYAVVGRFGLRIYQAPSGADVRSVGSPGRAAL